MFTNQRGGLACVCLLVLLGLNQALDQWNLEISNFNPQGHFLIDEENSRVVVAAMNTVLFLNLNLSRKLDSVFVPPEEEDYNHCLWRELRPPRSCQNYPSVLLILKGTTPILDRTNRTWSPSEVILTCGSNSYAPRCYYRKRSNLELLNSISANRYVPYAPFNSAPSVWTTTGRLVAATPADSLFNKFVVSVSNSPFDGAVSATTNSEGRLWFNRTPFFVSMYEIGDWVYVFFREEAVEAAEREQVIYSRVARICKSDRGKLLEGENILTTYTKARISCIVSSDFGVPYHYNELYGTYYEPVEQRLYGVFRSALNGPLGSVVCSYTFGGNENDLDAVFNGAYLVETESNRFIPQRTYTPVNCMQPRSLGDSQGLQLMAGVTTQLGSPNIIMENFGFHQVVVDRLNDYQEVFFITADRKSDDALVLLKVLVENGVTQRVIETTVLPKSDPHVTRVTKMQLYRTGSKDYLYIGTHTDILRVPVESCSLYTSCCECVTSRDPYCGFDSNSGLCVAVNGTASEQNLLQDLVNGSSAICVPKNVSSSINGVQLNTSALPCTEDVTLPRDNSSTTETNAGVVVDSTSTTGTGTPPGGEPGGAVTGLGVRREQSSVMQGQHSWIIVGTVGGFIGGVVIGIMIFLAFKRFGSRRNCKTFGSRAITHVSDVGSNGIQPKDEVLRINNSTSEFTNSNNFTRSSNEYTRHLPQHLKEPQTPIKNPLNTPEAEAAAKKLSPPSPPPEFASPPGKSQPKVFTFTSSSINMASDPDSTPKSPLYAVSVAGASSSDGSYQDPTETPTHTDPNLKLNYQARVYLTDSQRQSYGRNILARLPSIDGSKSKYITEHPGRVLSTSPYSNDSLPRGSHNTPRGSYPSDSLPRGSHNTPRGSYPSDSLPRGSYNTPRGSYPSDSLPRVSYQHRQQDKVQLDAELGCSQC